MTLWWIGNVIFIIVIIPVVVVLLQRMVKAASDVGANINAIHSQANGIVSAVDDVRALTTVRDAVKGVGTGLTRYVKAVDRIL